MTCCRRHFGSVRTLLLRMYAHLRVSILTVYCICVHVVGTRTVLHTTYKEGEGTVKALPHRQISNNSKYSNSNNNSSSSISNNNNKYSNNNNNNNYKYSNSIYSNNNSRSTNTNNNLSSNNATRVFSIICINDFFLLFCLWPIFLVPLT